jgi:uncharacterized protein
MMSSRCGDTQVGSSDLRTVTLLTDGSLEAVDILRIAGSGFTSSAINVHTHELQDVVRDPVWRKVHAASLTLPDVCQRCRWRDACGGGYVTHRWSRAREFDSPSVYCADLMRIFEHVQGRIERELGAAVATNGVSAVV